MQEIKLSIDDKNLDLVMSILNNLKSGLIENIESSKTTTMKRKHTAYQPKTNKVIYEETPEQSTQSGKYANPAAYKERLKKKK